MATASAADFLRDGLDYDVRVDEGTGWAEPKRIAEILPALLARLGLDAGELRVGDRKEREA